jgi:hypothetical protein
MTPVIQRYDIYYDMLTGKRAFEGEDVSDTIASVLKSDPDWIRLSPDVRAVDFTHPARTKLLKSGSSLPTSGRSKRPVAKTVQDGEPISRLA